MDGGGGRSGGEGFERGGRGLAKLALEKASDSKLVIRMAMKLARIVDKKVG